MTRAHSVLPAPAFLPKHTGGPARLGHGGLREGLPLPGARPAAVLPAEQAAAGRAGSRTHRPATARVPRGPPASASCGLGERPHGSRPLGARATRLRTSCSCAARVAASPAPSLSPELARPCRSRGRPAGEPCSPAGRPQAPGALGVPPCGARPRPRPRWHRPEGGAGPEDGAEEAEQGAGPGLCGGWLSGQGLPLHPRLRTARGRCHVCRGRAGGPVARARRRNGNGLGRGEGARTEGQQRAWGRRLLKERTQTQPHTL